MKKITFILPLFALVTSCTDYWSGANKRSFKETCINVVFKDSVTEEKANEYCQCVLEKMMIRYPNELDAFDHMGDLTKDTLLIRCRTEILKLK